MRRQPGTCVGRFGGWVKSNPATEMPIDIVSWHKLELVAGGEGADGNAICHLRNVQCLFFHLHVWRYGIRLM